jgi:hypothetical protein
MDTLNVTPSGSVGAWSWSTASAVNNAVFLSERLSVGERSTFGAGVRRERDTRADTAFRLYPSADAVWIAPTSLRGGQIRVRVAYGESAQPFELFAVQPLPIVPSLFGSGVGDTEDIPERLRELEGGVDLEWGRGAVGATLYHRSQNLLEIVPAIVPYARSVFARDAHTRGVELDARAVVLERSGWRWELRAIASMLRNRVGGSVALSTSNFAFLEEGSPIYGVTSADPSYSDANGDGLISRAELVQPTWNADLRPSTPTFEGGLHSTVTLGSRLTFLAIVDRHSGHYANAGSEAMHCRQPNCRDGEDLEASLAEQARALDLQSGRLVFTNAGFTRLREMSVRWTLAPGGGRARPFGDATLVVSGRDLATWTGWRGLDPEINTNRRGVLIQTDVGGVPLPRRFSIGLEVGSGAR